MGVYVYYSNIAFMKSVHKIDSLFFNKIMHITSMLKRAGEGAAELLFPRVCPVCGEPLPFLQKGRLKVHPLCYARLHRIRSPFCMKCGKELDDPQSEYCPDCIRTPRSFVSGRGLWRYDRASKQAVFALKYKNRPEHAAFFAECLFMYYGSWIRRVRPDCIVPVPVSREKRRQRGYNQAELIAEELGERLGIPVRGDILKRLRSTDPQKELDRAQRLRNLQHAFYADPNLILEGGRYLLLDDVYTTGATAECCTRALLKAGADQVWFLAACIGQQ